MYKDVNRMTFLPQEVENGWANKLLDFLMAFNREAEDCAIDIRVSTDGYCTIIEWGETYDSAGFKWVGEDQEVMERLYYPDNTMEYVLPEETEEKMNEWLDAHPTWVKNEITGRYYDKSEVVGDDK